MKRLNQAEINALEYRFAELNDLIKAGSTDPSLATERDGIARKLDREDRITNLMARGFRVVLGGLSDSDKECAS
jgi:hypothetical protein